MLERGGVEDEVYTGHGVQQAFGTAHIANIKLELVIVIGQSHVMLLLLVAAEDADFGDVGLQKTAQDGVAEGSISRTPL